ncbi:MAG: hypothetical protein D6776_08875 [Planctomycetota bacterium]|nr:MAG: hypothetical protein D6776_08875 [Planctomycetota bacterium]
MALALLAIVALAAALRLLGARAPHPIHRDGLQYLACARAASAGDWRHVAAADYSPGYPTLVALAARAAGFRADRPPRWIPERHRFEVADAQRDAPLLRAALGVSLLFGALAVLPAFAVGAALGGPRVGLWSALALALQPYHALYAGYVLTESSFFFFLLLTLAAAAWLARVQRPRTGWLAGIAVGIAGTLAFFVRPEVLAVLLPAAVLGTLRPSRGRALFGMALGFALLAGPYLWIYNAERAGPSGAVVLTPKRPVAQLAASALDAPTAFVRRLVRNLGQLVEYGHPLVLALALTGAVLAWRSGGRSARRLVALVLAAAALYLGVVSAVRIDHRLVLGVGVLLVPLAGVSLERVRVALASRWGRARAIGALVVVLLASTVPILVHKSRPRRTHLLEAAAVVRRERGEARGMVLVHDPRLAYYAGGRWCALAALDHVVDPEQAARLIARGEVVVLGLERGREPDAAALGRASGRRLEPVAVIEPAPGERFRAYEIYTVAPRAGEGAAR